ncbi:hypothetical protein D9M71_416610 [compost metagenome]
MAATQHGAQAGCQFPRVAGFGQVVVGAQLQAEDAVQGFATGGKHQHRQLGMVAAQLLEQLQAAAVGQHHIEHHCRRGMLGQGDARRLAVMAGADVETFLAEPADQQLAEFLVVVDKQQFTHGAGQLIH